jgi:hypothetical protein
MNGLQCLNPRVSDAGLEGHFRPWKRALIVRLRHENKAELRQAAKSSTFEMADLRLDIIEPSRE